MGESIMKKRISKAGIIACAAAGVALAAVAVALTVYLKRKNELSVDPADDEKEILPVPETTLAFSSFDGGGPKYSVSIDDEGIIAYDEKKRYDDPDHDQMGGCGYDVIFTFRGVAPGRTNMTISARSPIAENYDNHYSVTVSDSLEVTIERIPESDETAEVTEQ